MLFKNAASQKVRVFAFDSTTGQPKTGDAANISAYISKDYGAITQLTDTSATEEDSINAKGYYLFDITQTETNADDIEITGKSSTINIVVVGAPARMATRPPNAGALSIDSNGRVDVIKVNGTSQTARDLGASVLLSVGTGAGQLNVSGGKAPATLASTDVTGNLPANLAAVLATALTETTGGNLAAALKKLLDVASPVLTAASVNQTGDSFARLGAPAGASIAADILTTNNRLTAARAGYLDNLNVGGAVASHADIAAINQSASKHVLLQTVGQYERPESGSTVYTVEARTYSAADGSAVNADTTPTLTATGQTSGDLSANLSAATNPATGLYRWTYTVASGATQEPVRFDVSATIASSTFTLSAYSQVVDMVSATWTTTDHNNLTAIFNKLPANTIADETLVLAAVGSPMQAGAHVQLATSQDQYAPAKAGDAMTLTGAYDAAKTAAQVGSQMNLADGAITDAKITFPAEAAGRPTTFLAAMRRVWEWATNKRVRTRATGVVQLRNAADSADLETQTQSTTGGTGSEVDTQTKGA